MPPSYKDTDEVLHASPDLETGSVSLPVPVRFVKGEKARLSIMITWDGQTELADRNPSPDEIAIVLTGLAATYRELARVLGYPPHQLGIRSARNPQLQFGLEGGKEIILALHALVHSIPSVIANLFRLNEAADLASQENRTRLADLKAREGIARANLAEAEARQLRAEIEVLDLRSQLQGVPLVANEDARQLLELIFGAIADASPTKREAFLGETAKYHLDRSDFRPRRDVLVTSQLDRGE